VVQPRRQIADGEVAVGGRRRRRRGSSRRGMRNDGGVADALARRIEDDSLNGRGGLRERLSPARQQRDQPYDRSTSHCLSLLPLDARAAVPSGFGRGESATVGDPPQVRDGWSGCWFHSTSRTVIVLDGMWIVAIWNDSLVSSSRDISPFIGESTR